jgi:hypothetical protein
MKAKLIGVVTILLALTGCQNQTRQTAAPNRAPAVVQAAAPATPVAPTAAPPASTPSPANTASPYKTTEPMDEEAIKREKALKHFLSLPDPAPPVALDKIEGEWWTDDELASNKVYAFVEETDASHGPLRHSLSLSNGTKLNVRCLQRHPVNRPTENDRGHCNLLPLFHWTRLATGDVITNPEAQDWVIRYRGKDYDTITYFVVDYICYSNSNCMSLQEEGQRELEKLREKARRGEN